MTRPSLSGTGLLADTGRPAVSPVRSSSSAAALRGGGQKRFASLLDGQDHAVASPAPDHDTGHDSSPAPDGEAGHATAHDTRRGETARTGQKQAAPPPARATGGQEDRTLEDPAADSGAEPQDAISRKGADRTGTDEQAMPDASSDTASLESSLSFAAFMVTPQSGPGNGFLQAGHDVDEEHVAATDSVPSGRGVGQAGEFAGLYRFSALPDDGNGGDEGHVAVTDSVPSGRGVGQAGEFAGLHRFSALPDDGNGGDEGAASVISASASVSALTSASASALPSALASSSSLEKILGSGDFRQQGPVSSHGGTVQAQASALNRPDASLPHGGLTEAYGAVSDPGHAGAASPLTVQGGAGTAFSLVRAMSFQAVQSGRDGAGITGSAAVSGGSLKGAGGTDSLFTLMVKESVRGQAAAFSGAGGDGGAATGQGHAGSGDSAASGSDAGDGPVVAGTLLTGSASFAGVLAHGEEGASSSTLSAGVQAGPVSGAVQAGASGAGRSGGAQLAGGLAAGVLTGQGGTAQAGTLNMMVMAPDATPVHVQLTRSADGLAALSLQGGNETMTDTLQKTRHLLSRQLDEAGLHAGGMKIDVLPAGSGQMAGGQEHGMSGRQGGYPGAHSGQEAGQSGGQAGFQMGGGFLAGGGAGGQGHQAARHQAPATLSPLQGSMVEANAGESTAATADPASRPVLAGRLNISV